MNNDFPLDALLAWHAKHARDGLPWRALAWLDDGDRGYRVWLSEILLQQTQAERVVPYYRRILDRFPDIRTLAGTDYDTFFQYYRGLGYYSRARNLLRTAVIVVHEFGWVFPRETEKLRKLPGIGAYTAEAIRAFAYDIPTLALDTNLARVFARYVHGTKHARVNREWIASLIDILQLWKYSSRLVNAALMDYGALAWREGVSDTTIARDALPGCRYAETRWGLERARKKSRSAFPTRDAVRIVLLHENHRRYFSIDAREYAPFFIPSSGVHETRADVQNFFSREYGLSVSVRPPHARGFLDDAPFVACTAQIQTGVHDFHLYSRVQVAAWRERIRALDTMRSL